MSEQNDRQAQDQQAAPIGSTPASVQQQPPASDQPLPPPAPTSSPAAQPQPPVSAQSTAPDQQAAPAEQPQPAQPAQPQQPPQPSQPQQPGSTQQQPTFRENGAFSFFATPSDPDDDPAPMSWGFKIGWFVLGLIGGMLGLLMAWISTSTLSPKRRRQAVMWTWGGFAVQAIIFLVIVLNGGSFPFIPGGSTAAQSAGSAGSGSTSAFG